jgi:ribonuclease BN (tRNA processing enzyme)
LRKLFVDNLPSEATDVSSLFVEFGCGESFVFDISMGCQFNYTAMQAQSSKMCKIFLMLLHGDHASDLSYTIDKARVKPDSVRR